MTKRKRLKPEVRKESILAAAVPLAEEHGYACISRDAIAAAAGVTGPTLSHYFGTMAQFRRDLMRYAIREECLRILAQGLAAGSIQAQRAPPDLRRRALSSVDSITPN
jgi:AcrR family transcriptional regulator